MTYNLKTKKFGSPIKSGSLKPVNKYKSNILV